MEMGAAPSNDRNVFKGRVFSGLSWIVIFCTTGSFELIVFVNYFDFQCNTTL